MSGLTLENPRNAGHLWDNEARPKGAGHTSRPLTHSSELSREGLAMKATRDAAPVYDDRARENFWSKVTRTPTCWLWTAYTNGDGYGTFCLHRGGNRWTLRAHRVAYELTVAGIPKDAVLDHICRVRNCVNPAHLRLASNRENVLAGIGGTAINARKTHCQNGHEFTDENTYRYPTRNIRECRTCRAEAHRRRKAAKSTLLNPTEGEGR